MCVGIPARVVEVEPSGPHTALVDVEGTRREVNTMLVDDVALVVGEWVLLHVGFAMARLDETAAAETLALLRGEDRDLAGPVDEPEPSGTGP